MKFNFNLSIAALSMLSYVMGHELELNQDNFDKEISGGNFIVMFYSPTCKYSKLMLPVFGESVKAKSAIGKERGFHFAKVNCKSEKGSNLCNAQKIEGYPTLYVYSNGQKKEEYMGDSVTEDLSKYIETVSAKYQKKY